MAQPKRHACLPQSRPCAARCGRPVDGWDNHLECVVCLGLQHALDGVTTKTCGACGMFSDAILRSRLDMALDHQTRKPLRLFTPHAQHSSAVRALPFSEEGSATRRGATCTATLSSLRAAGPALQEAGSQTFSDAQCSSGMELGDDDLTSFQPPLRDVNMVSPRHDAPHIDANEVVTLDIDDDEGDCFDDDEEEGEDTSSWRRPSSVHSEWGAEEDAAQAATSSSRPDAGEKEKEKAPKDAPKDSVNTIFRRAVGRLGLQFSDDAANEPTVDEADQFVGQPQISCPKKKLAFKKLPVSAGLRSALHTCWKEGTPSPAELHFNTAMEGTAELGLRGLPPMTRLLTECFANTVASGNPYVTTTDPPTLSDKHVKKQQQDAKTLYGRAAHQVRYLNASAILLGSAHKLLHPAGGLKEPTPREKELQGILPLLVSLHAKSVECVGDVLATVVRTERDRWTDPLTLKQGDIIKKLRTLPVTPTELFPGGYDLLRAVTEQHKVAQEMTAAVAPRAPPPPAVPSTSTGRRGRSKSRSTERPAPAAPPAAQENHGQPGAGRGRAGGHYDDDHTFQRPEPPRFYVRGRGARGRK